MILNCGKKMATRVNKKYRKKYLFALSYFILIKCHLPTFLCFRRETSEYSSCIWSILDRVKKTSGRKINFVLRSGLGIPYLATAGQWLRTYWNSPNLKGDFKNGFPLPPAHQSGERSMCEKLRYTNAIYPRIIYNDLVSIY